MFDGYPLTRMFQATGALIEHIDKEVGRTQAERSVLEHDLNTLLGDIRVAPAPGGYDDMTGAARLAQLRQPRLVRTILDVAWHEYDSARLPLLRWLDDLVASGDARPVAAAAGLLCGYDFDQVHDVLLGQWAKSDTRARRVAAALACEMAVRQPSLTERVLRCLRSWIHSGSAYRRDTAVRTYATDTFLDLYPLVALSVFESTARDDLLQRTSSAIPFGVEHIYSTHSLEVLDRLVAWARSDHPNLQTMASRCLVLLAGQESRAQGQPLRPRLLAQTLAAEILVEDHAALWPYALLHPATGRRAWSALEGWIGRAAGDPQIAGPLLALFGVILRVTPVRTRARFYVKHLWRGSLRNNPLLGDLNKLLEE